MLETERCRLSAFQEKDREEVAQLFSNPKVRMYLGGVREPDTIRTILDEMLESMDDACYWVVREKDTAEFMGLISIDLHHEGADQELSYQFMPDWWGRGYAAESAAAVIDFAFEKMKLPALVAETQSANLASCRLLEKLGMELERTVVRFGEEQSIYAIRPV